MGGGSLAEERRQRAVGFADSGPSFAAGRPLFQDDKLRRGDFAPLGYGIADIARDRETQNL